MDDVSSIVYNKNDLPSPDIMILSPDAQLDGGQLLMNDIIALTNAMLPVGGDTGDILQKATDGDFDMQWVPVENLQGPEGPQGPQGPPGIAQIVADLLTRGYAIKSGQFQKVGGNVPGIYTWDVTRGQYRGPVSGFGGPTYLVWYNNTWTLFYNDAGGGSYGSGEWFLNGDYNALPIGSWNSDAVSVNVPVTIEGINLQSTPPTHNNSLGNTGDIALDTDYIYVCVATNTWKRVALSSDTW